MSYKFKTTKERSRLMQRIKSSNTTPERILRKALLKIRLKHKRGNKNLPGKPDIVLSNDKVVIFIDGEFWHGYKWREKKKKLKANRAYWIPKIERTIKRDKSNNKKLKKIGWHVIRLWQHQIVKDLPKCIQMIRGKAKKVSR